MPAYGNSFGGTSFAGDILNAYSNYYNGTLTVGYPVASQSAIISGLTIGGSSSWGSNMGMVDQKKAFHVVSTINATVESYDEMDDAIAAAERMTAFGDAIILGKIAVVSPKRDTVVRFSKFGAQFDKKSLGNGEVKSEG